MDYKKIYENSFKSDRYNLHPDEEFRFQYVLNFIKKNNFKSLIDVGTGRGNLINVVKQADNTIDILSSDLKKFHNFDVPFVEINLCDESVFDSYSVKHFDILTCLDVMEHIEKKCVENILSKFAKISKYSVLTIANHSDILNGVELHVIQENLSYWLPILKKYFEVIDQQEYYNGRLYLFTLKSL